MSKPAPNAQLNNQTLPHQIVVALPIRHDGRIWTGTVTASKPIEVEVEHKYNRYNMTIDAQHGEPYHAKWFDGTNIALSTMTMFSCLDKYSNKYRFIYIHWECSAFSQDRWDPIYCYLYS